MKPTGIAILSGIVTALILTLGGATAYLFVQNQKLHDQVAFLTAVKSNTESRTKTDVEICQINLSSIATIKDAWEIETNPSANAEPTKLDLIKYFDGGFPRCPAGGHYYIGRIGEKPGCSVQAHALADSK
jgi:hypothetical protein